MESARDCGGNPPAGDAGGGEGSVSYRSGFIAVLGLPNVGKSTLINVFFEGAPLITSPKPQTTRFHVRCIHTDERRQVILVDTPGWYEGGEALARFMRREIERAIDGVDVLLYVVDASRPALDENERLYRRLLRGAGKRTPVVMVLNKVDLAGKERTLELLDTLWKRFSPREIVPVSALQRFNVDELDRVVTSLLPEGPMLYPPEMVVDRDEEFLFGEFIREQIYHVTHQEIPFKVAVDVQRVEREEGRIFVEAYIYVVRDSQKGILIGREGRKIKEIKKLASIRIRRFTGCKVELSLRVKVAKNWTKRASLLGYFGYR